MAASGPARRPPPARRLPIVPIPAVRRPCVAVPDGSGLRVPAPGRPGVAAVSGSCGGLRGGL
eukprot:9991068-Prorocentrum_lima.AAC.1